MKDAYKQLDSAEGRAAVAARVEDRELRKLAEQTVAQQERERQWRVAKGLEPAGAGGRAGGHAGSYHHQSCLFLI